MNTGFECGNLRSTYVMELNLWNEKKKKMVLQPAVVKVNRSCVTTVHNSIKVCTRETPTHKAQLVHRHQGKFVIARKRKKKIGSLLLCPLLAVSCTTFAFVIGWLIFLLSFFDCRLPNAKPQIYDRCRRHCLPGCASSFVFLTTHANKSSNQNK